MVSDWPPAEEVSPQPPREHPQMPLGSTGHPTAHAVPATSSAAVAQPTPRRVALLVETSNSYGRRLLAGVRRFADSRAHWSLYLSEFGRMDSGHAWLHGWQGDGVLARIEQPQTAELVARIGLPTVDLSANRLNPALPYVETDDATIAAWAARHFIERGFRHFAYCGDERYAWSSAREAAFAEAVNLPGASFHRFALRTAGGPPAAREQLASWLQALPRPTAIFACYDIAGQEVLETCRMLRLHVPEQVAVLGVDNDHLFCTMASPPLSSIQPDAASAGLLAAQLLEQMMQGQQVPARLHPVRPAKLITRQSTDVVSVSDPFVSAAVALIRRSAAVPLSAEQVCAQVGMSRRALDQRFRRALASSVHAEIVRARVTQVQRLLLTTDWPLPRVAERLGFSHPEYMSAMFKREVGLSPGAYRRREAHDGV